MSLFIFQVDPKVDLDLVWQVLEDQGCRLLYSEEEEGQQRILGHMPEGKSAEDILNICPELIGIAEGVLPSIDWEQQWALHAPNYHDGILSIDLMEIAPLLSTAPWPSKILLQPGEGFGNLTHPTTRLVLNLMSTYVPGQDVLDIGSGSGILSLAAVAWGANSVCGVDIDLEAIKHAHANSQLNKMENKIVFCLPDELTIKRSARYVILMNMIQSEQKQAWSSLQSLNVNVKTVITSGILQEERSSYLALTGGWGWTLLDEKEEEGWLAFCFQIDQSE